MTIRLLTPYDKYPVNAIVSLDAGTEAGLIAAKMAQADTTGGTAYVAPTAQPYNVPAQLVYDASGNVLGIAGAGGEVISLGSSNPRLPYAKGFDIFDTYRITDRRQLTLPNPYSAVGSDMVHPSVVYVPTGWMGWRYWMAYTPYPTANSDYENPCIAVSQDGEAWETPAGLTNPLVGKPVGGYNADTHLFLSPDNLTMYMAYRERISGGANTVYVMETKDGISWSARRSILSGLRSANQDYASPSIFWDATNNRWTCISHNLDTAGLPMQLNVTSGADLYSGWSANQAVTIAHPTAGRGWWHSYFDRTPDGRVVGLIQDQLLPGSGAGGALYAAESLDGGLTFGVKLVYSDTNYYRPAFNFVQFPSGETGITAWVGRLAGSFSIQREDWRQGEVSKRLSDAVSDVVLKGSTNAFAWRDDFNRADGALGSPLTGTALTIDTGSFTIASNKVVSGAAGNNRAMVDVGSANHAVETIMTALPAAGWLIFRGVDTSNFYRIGLPGVAPSTLTIQSIVGGAISLNKAVANVAGAQNVPLQIRVVCRGRRFRIYVNGAFMEEIQDNATFNTGTKIGFQGTNAGVAFDYLLGMV